jgi:hypothetical protein
MKMGGQTVMGHTGAKPTPHSEPQLTTKQGQAGKTGPSEPEAGRSADNARRVFISFVGAHPDDQSPDPDGLTHEARMALEEVAIAFILAEEPSWQRMPQGNPGYDLFKSDAAGLPHEWCEVKAMGGTLDDRPVGISRTQFDFARDKGASAWLYIVEHAGNEQARLVRIQDPVSQARTFTFDHGWRAVAVPAGASA